MSDTGSETWFFRGSFGGGITGPALVAVVAWVGVVVLQNVNRRKRTMFLGLFCDSKHRLETPTRNTEKRIRT